MKKTCIYYINTYDDYLNIKEKFTDYNYIFRGVTNPNYGLVPSLYRSISDDIDEITKLFLMEDDMFKMIIDIEKKTEMKISLDDLCRLQHYGVKTRLLDFTKNIDIALTFALYDFYGECLDDNGFDSVIYVLNKKEFQSAEHEDDELLADLIYNFNKNDITKIKTFDGRIASYPLKPKYFEYTSKSIERINKQQGCFILFPHAFSDDIKIKDEDIFAKIIISNKAKSELYRKHNISIKDLK